MSGASGKVHFQNLSSLDEDLEVKYKVPKFQALSKKYKKFENFVCTNSKDIDNTQKEPLG